MNGEGNPSVAPVVGQARLSASPANTPGVDSRPQSLRCATWGCVWVPARKSFGRVCIYCGCRS